MVGAGFRFDMNSVRSSGVTASGPGDRLGKNGGTSSYVVVIPSYNTGARLFQTVAAIRRQGYPVWVVIDGSTDGTGEELCSIAADDPDLHIFVLPRNRGKGAAILHALRLAHAQGLTHAVTMDADGQHSADDLDAFIAASRANPEAMVLGVPIFDASAPPIRVAGHRIANFWADLVTLRSGIGNSLFGFRVYPVTPLLQVFNETRWMRRFDFDSEAAIRLSWRGVPAVNLPTPVRYFRREDGGVSHFRYLRDNMLLGFMYVRLFAGLGFRLPVLLARRFRLSRINNDSRAAG
jgi:glycosyltransferase involved in cell wall biosynthesis